MIILELGWKWAYKDLELRLDNYLLDVLLLPDVAPGRLDSTQPPHGLGGAPHLALVPGGDHHAGPQGQELLGDGLANTRPSAYNKRTLILNQNMMFSNLSLWPLCL